MTQQKILERLGYIQGKEYVFTTKLDLNTLKRALAESSGKTRGKGIDSGKILVRPHWTRVTLTFFTLRGGAVMGPVFKSRLQKIDNGFALRGKFQLTWFEMLAFSLMRVGSTYRVLEIIILRSKPWEAYEYYMMPVIMVIAWAAPLYCWNFSGPRTDMMIGHLNDLGLCVSSEDVV